MRPIPFLLAILILIFIDQFGNNGRVAEGFVDLLNHGIQFILHTLRIE